MSPAQIIYWITVELILDRPLVVEDEEGVSTGEKARGVIMSFGVTAASPNHAKRLIEAQLACDARLDGLSYRIKFDHVGEIQDLAREIYEDEEVASALLQDPRSAGLWYRTGMGWYDDD